MLSSSKSSRADALTTNFQKEIPRRKTLSESPKQLSLGHKVGVLLPNCWGNALDRTLCDVNPQLVITGHENEMSHSMDHREDYTQTYNRLFGSKYPALVMAWGETYLYQKDTGSKP